MEYLIFCTDATAATTATTSRHTQPAHLFPPRTRTPLTNPIHQSLPNQQPLAQSTSTPFVLKSALAILISSISSAYASGVSRKVSMPQPRRKSSQAPNETRAQKGSCPSVSFFVHNHLPPPSEGRRNRREMGEWVTGTYNGDDGFLDGGREGQEAEVEGEVELLWVVARARKVSLVGIVRVASGRVRVGRVRSSRGARGRWSAGRAPWCCLSPCVTKRERLRDAIAVVCVGRLID